MRQAILLTGADGFIGRRLYEALKDEYRVVRIVYPGQGDDPERDIFPFDLTRTGKTTELAERFPVREYKAVVHLAAVLCRPGEWKDIKYFDQNNAITKTMVELMGTLQCEAFVNFSSLAVYPNRSGVYDEESLVNMADNTECLYGLAKFNSEMLFRFFLKDITKVVNLRLTQVYGPGMQDDRLVGMFRKELAEKNTITVFGNGERVSNFVHVDDIAGGVRKVLHNPVAGTFNFGHAKNMSYMELAEQVVDGCGRSGSKIEPVSKGVRAKTAIDTTKFEKCYDFRGLTKNFSS
jgi:UDP-glucose 4-epimerase